MSVRISVYLLFLFNFSRNLSKECVSWKREAKPCLVKKKKVYLEHIQNGNI